MQFPRFLHRIYARAMCYFWKPCPICGMDFGGHEAGDSLYLIVPGNGVLVCKSCSVEAARRNRSRFGRHVYLTPAGIVLPDDAA